MAGTFVLVNGPAKSVQTKSGTWVSYDGSLTPPRDNGSLVVGINSFSDSVMAGVNFVLFCGKQAASDPSAIGTHECRFNFSFIDNNISLDGGSWISWSGLPAGFQPTSATLSLRASKADTAGSTYALELASGVLQAIVLTGSNATYSFPYGTVPDMLTILTNGFGVKATFAGANDFATWHRVALTGAYTIVNFSWTMSPTGLVTPNTKISVTSSGTNALNMNHITVSLEYQDPNTKLFISLPIVGQPPITNFSFIFLLPITLPVNTPISVVATGDGTQFSGSVVLGIITIYVADASGIYVLTPGKTADTLYGVTGVRSVSIPTVYGILDWPEEELEEPIVDPSFTSTLAPQEEEEQLDDQILTTLNTTVVTAVTTDVAIPTPFVKTGFLP